MDHDAGINNISQRQDTRCFVRDKIQEAIEAAGFTDNQLLVLLMFSRRMTSDPNAIISVAADELHKLTGLSLRSISRTMRALESRGALELHRKAAPGQAAGYAFGPTVLAPFGRELAGVAERKAARPAKGTPATVADVAEGTSATVADVGPERLPRWPATSMYSSTSKVQVRRSTAPLNPVKSTNTATISFGQHRGQPWSEIPTKYLRDFVLKKAERATAADRTAAEAELQRRDRIEALEPRQAEWDRTAEQLEDAVKDRQRKRRTTHGG